MNDMAEALKIVDEMLEQDFEALGWDLFFHGGKSGDLSKHCCPGDDYGAAYERGLLDVRERLAKALKRA